MLKTTLKLPKYYLRFDYSNYVFTKPIAVLCTNNYSALNNIFKKIEQYLKQDYWVAGYFAYELGYHLLPNLPHNSRSHHPLLHLAVFKQPAIIPKLNGNLLHNPYHITQLKFNETINSYQNKINLIKNYIRNGETYQVNFTGQYRFKFSGSPLALYEQLKQNQPVPYAAYCKLNQEHIISLSPELFFEQTGNIITTKPMKGTAARGYNNITDNKQASYLHDNKKDRAENVMIVDLMRNDFSKICQPGSVTVPKLFTVEKYRTLLQMTSTVTGRLKPNTSFTDIIKALFPGGSITGAPKLRTMQFIQQLEQEPRGVYCGALGYIDPNRQALFNLPIRTIYIKGRHGEMGIGSGITYDSDPKKEYQECLLKAKFLTHTQKPFQLIETILWKNDYGLLNEHLQRLKNSAKYFSYQFSLPALKKQLHQYAKRHLSKNQPYKIRILLDQTGHVTITGRDVACNVSTKQKPIGKVIFSKHKTDPTNIFLYHKTTNRALYNKEYKKYSKLGYTDVLFCNKNNEITEGSIHNIIIKKNNKYFTPPVACGLLPGIYRAYFMNTHNVTEKILTKQDLKEADKVYICNSVRGLVRVDINI
ncbi:MAG: aminodeoxychorismate synthase component I [Patescibacteria group bacterium]|jgi:para-aminobenzoate synthetase/4-amino-4-deoxychorismate lyase